MSIVVGTWKTVFFGEVTEVGVEEWLLVELLLLHLMNETDGEIFDLVDDATLDPARVGLFSLVLIFKILVAKKL